MVPSRELAMQIMRVGQAVLPNEARGCVQQAIGGANPRRQVCAPIARKTMTLIDSHVRLPKACSGRLHRLLCSFGSVFVIVPERGGETLTE